MRHLIVLGLLAVTLFGRDQALGQERGIVPFRATVVKVHEDALDLSVFDRNDDEVPRRQPVRFEVAKDARFEEVEVKLEGGKARLQRKAIALGELTPTQSISVIATVAGDRRIILVGVASASGSASEALKRIAKLKGTVRNVAWDKNETRYDVDLSNSDVTDDELLLIASLDGLDTLRLSNTKITDKGIANLANHPRLNDLTLSGTQVTNAALASLATMRSLHRVSVDRTGITREAMLRFAKRQGLNSFCQIGAGAKGEYRVFEELGGAFRQDPPYVYLMKRDVYYARFYTEGPSRRKATTYYHRDGPVGAVLRRFEWFAPDGPDDLSVMRLPASLLGLAATPVGGTQVDALASLWSEPALGVVELNGGTIAAYGRPCQTIDFYNDTPELTSFNVKTGGKDPPFGYIEDARGRGTNVRVIEGPFKKTVRKEAPRGYYSALFVDITVQQRQDPKAITKEDVHFDLMTQEGLRDLMDTTAPGGVVCYHTSHRTHNFYKPLAAAAAALGFATKKVLDNPFDPAAKPPRVDESHYSCEWLVVARRPEHLANLRTERSRTRNMQWSIPAVDIASAWRDGAQPEMPSRLLDP